MSKQERRQQIIDCNEAISTYEWLLEDALRINDTEQVKFLREQIQKTKRQKIALKKNEEFKLHPTEELYFAMMGA